jgi:hypothetical protein
MDNPYEQQQTALLSRIINNVVCIVTVIILFKEKLNEAIVELSRSLQVSPRVVTAK